MEIDSRPKAVAIAVALGVAGFAVALVISLLVGLILGPVGASLSPEGLVVLNLLILQGTAFPLTALAYLHLRGKSLGYLRASLPSLRDIGWGVIAAVVAFLLAAVFLSVVARFGIQTAERTDTQLLQQPSVLLVLIPLAILVIGPGEELLFRGAIQTTLREQFGVPAAVVIANLAFAPAHVIAFTGSASALLVSISLLFVPSLAFGAVYEHTDNLVVPSLAHGLYDVAIFGLVYLAVVSGATDAGSVVAALSP